MYARGGGVTTSGSNSMCGHPFFLQEKTAAKQWQQFPFWIDEALGIYIFYLGGT
jgi:hypothetical protein